MKAGLAVLARTLCPMEVFLLLLCVVSGVASLLSLGGPDPLSLLLPGWLVLSWRVVLLVGSLAALLGLARLNWLVVRVGYTLLGPAALAYGLALSPYLGSTSVKVSVASLVIFGLACLWRVGQVTAMIQKALQ